jgi:hypothetical protein
MYLDIIYAMYMYISKLYHFFKIYLSIIIMNKCSYLNHLHLQ